MTIHYFPYYLLIILSALVLSCSSDSPENNENEFQIETDLTQFSYGIDERISFHVFPGENLKEFCVRADNYSERHSVLSRCFYTTDLEPEIPVHLSFPSQGTRTITISAVDIENRTGELQFEIQIGLVNTLRIKKIRILSFSGKGETYDPGFLETDPNRLADPVFVIQKRLTGVRVDENGFSDSDWFVSEILENEGSLTWDVSDKNLIIGENTDLKFYLYDDGPTISYPPNLLRTNPDFEMFNFSEFSDSRPGEVLFEREDIGLEILFEVDWNQ